MVSNSVNFVTKKNREFVVFFFFFFSGWLQYWGRWFQGHNIFAAGNDTER